MNTYTVKSKHIIGSRYFKYKKVAERYARNNLKGLPYLIITKY